MGKEQELQPLAIPSGTMLGKFEVLRRIATGGMAEIYLARVRGHAGFEKLVVIKRILPTAADNPRLIQMFLDEARLVAAFQHPNLADVYEVGEHLGYPFFAMQYVHGQDVRAIRKAAVERRQGVPLRVSLAIVHATAAALDYAHDRCDAEGTNLNLVHRDVSPSNILVSFEGAIKLIDFGVARVTSQSHTTQSGTVRGKCPYMSPEQCRGLPLDRRSDLFSLGTVMYELTVGRRPFIGASDFEVMNQIVNVDPEIPSIATAGYPPELERIVMKLLVRDLEKRYQTSEQLLHDLETFIDAYRLWVPPKKLSRYMRTLFGDRLIAWETATQGDTATFAEHVALSMEPDYRRAGEVTPITKVPVVMRLAQEIELVAQDLDASFAQVYRDDDPNDPLKAILAPDDGLGDDSVLHGKSVAKLVGDTVTIRTGEPEMLEESFAQPRAGDTVTERSADTKLQEPPAFPSGDTVTTPWESRTDAGQARTVTERGVGDPSGPDTTTIRRDGAEATSPGWPAPSTAGANPPPASGARQPLAANLSASTEPRNVRFERAVRSTPPRGVPVRVERNRGKARPTLRVATTPHGATSRSQRLWLPLGLGLVIGLTLLLVLMVVLR